MEEVVIKSIILLVHINFYKAVFEWPFLKFLSSSCEAQAKKTEGRSLASRQSSHIEEMRGEESRASTFYDYNLCPINLKPCVQWALMELESCFKITKNKIR